MARFQLITQGERGFAEGERFYPLGMSSRLFLDSFGVPDVTKAEEDGEDPVEEFCYFAEGLTVTSIDDRIHSTHFFVRPCCIRGGEEIAPADMVTDMGIDAASSLRQVVNAHGTGRPPLRGEGKLPGTRVFVGWGWFRFSVDHRLVDVVMIRPLFDGCP